MTIWKYADLLPPLDAAHRLSLGEGGTALVRSRRIGPAAGLPHLYFKLEGQNPTGSYKDRFAASAVSHMLAQDQTRCLATSSGNTGAALAACCALAGLPCQIAVVEPAPEAKLDQMRAYGASLYRVKGFGLDPTISHEVMAAVQKLGAEPGCALQISAFCFSPLGMSGVQTISYEIAEALPEVGAVFCPAGGGGLTLAIARGFEAWVKAGRLAAGPAVHCAQPEGNATIAGPLREGLPRARAVKCTSNISGLQVPSVLDGDDVVPACRTSGGTGHLVTDAEVFAMQRALAREEGIFSEPAGAVAAAAAVAAARAGALDPSRPTVCLVTGTGFKDAASVSVMARDAVLDDVTVAGYIERMQAGSGNPARRP